MNYKMLFMLALAFGAATLEYTLVFHGISLDQQGINPLPSFLSAVAIASAVVTIELLLARFWLRRNRKCSICG